MGKYTFTSAQTGLEKDITIDAKWIQGIDPFLCVWDIKNPATPYHGGVVSYDPNDCATSHIYQTYSGDGL